MLVTIAAALSACAGSLPSQSPDSLPEEVVATSSVPVFSYEVVNSYPHDPGAFTQGLVYDGSYLYEGTGELGKSTLRKVDMESGRVIMRRLMRDDQFGEGITIFGDNVIQLTWLSNIGFVYDKDSFAYIRDFSINTEGWGLTTDGERLIMSSGTDELRFMNPNNFEVEQIIRVGEDGSPLNALNELEYINGAVYANVWQSDRIAIIEPAAGQVTGWIDLSGLLEEKYREGAGVLNGIAYDAENETLLVTGKNWPRLYEIAVITD